jgi:hypothetical protein
MLKRQVIENRTNVWKLVNVQDTDFAYAVLKNKNKLESKNKEIQEELQKLEIENPTEEYLQYHKDREALGAKYAKKDENGKPMTKIVKNRQMEDVEQFVVDDEDLEKFKEEIDKLNLERGDILNYRKEQEKKYMDEMNRILDEEIELEIHHVEKIPKNMSATELEAAEFMIAK